jgi:release factor glutamine methyltransferase
VPDSDLVINRLRAAGCVFAEDEAALLIEAARTPAELDDMIARRVEGLPLEQILGWAEFCGLRIAIDPGVFVPRRRTELLARQAVALLRSDSVVLDMCCGTGAVGAVLAGTINTIELYATDVDPREVACARRNLAAFGGHVFQGDLFAPLPASLRGRIDVLTANAPYVPTDSVEFMPPEARLYEPLVALDGGSDGLDILRRVIAEAPRWLAPGGHLLVETSARQAPTLAGSFAASGLTPEIHTDEDETATILIGRSSATARPSR